MTGDFLSRWSRRKRAVEREAAQPEPAAAAPEDRLADPEDAPAADSAAEAGAVDPALPPEEAAALPALDSLTAASDLGPFLRSGVPSVLRNAALRRMWSLDPGIRDFVSEAREYAYDWNCPGGVPGLGPLLPTDDVGAMVRRLFDGPAPEAGGEPEPVREAGAASPPGIRAEEPPALLPAEGGEALPIEGAGGTSPVGEGALLAPAAIPGVGALTSAADAGSSREGAAGEGLADASRSGAIGHGPGAPDRDPPRDSPLAPRRLRRHGGAMPS